MKRNWFDVGVTNSNPRERVQTGNCWLTTPYDSNRIFILQMNNSYSLLKSYLKCYSFRVHSYLGQI